MTLRNNWNNREKAGRLKYNGDVSLETDCRRDVVGDIRQTILILYYAELGIDYHHDVVGDYAELGNTFTRTRSEPDG